MKKKRHVTRLYFFITLSLIKCSSSFFTLLMRFVAILFPIWPRPMNPTVVAFVDIMRAKHGANFVIWKAILTAVYWEIFNLKFYKVKFLSAKIKRASALLSTQVKTKIKKRRIISDSDKTTAHTQNIFSRWNVFFFILVKVFLKVWRFLDVLVK